MTWIFIVSLIGMASTIVWLALSRSKLAADKADQYVRLVLAQDMVARSRAEQLLAESNLVKQKIQSVSRIAQLSAEITRLEGVLRKDPALAGDLLRDLGTGK